MGEVDCLDGCVHELLNYARSDAVANQTLDPADLVQDTLARLRSTLARRIVEWFDGRLTVTSPPGGGARVLVSLPMAPRA